MSLNWIFTPGVREVMGSIPVGDTECFFVPHSCHVYQFTFHILLPSLRFIIFIYLLQSHDLFYYYGNSLRRENDFTELEATFSFLLRPKKYMIRKELVKIKWNGKNLLEKLNTSWRYEDMIQFSKCSEISHKSREIQTSKLYIFKRGWAFSNTFNFLTRQLKWSRWYIKNCRVK